jgi:hypothetical protein
MYCFFLQRLENKEIYNIKKMSQRNKKHSYSLQRTQQKPSVTRQYQESSMPRQEPSVPRQYQEPSVPCRKKIEERHPENPNEYLEELEEKVTTIYPKKLDGLVRLKESMISSEGKSCFDQEDLTLVDNEIKLLSKQLDCLRREWRHKNHMYNETLVNMETMLQTREQILNDVNTETELFSLHPNLTHQFATKQAELVKSMNHLREQMYESWNSKIQ